MITIEQVKEKTEERFWSKIKFGEPNECWEWQAYKFKAGYGQYHNWQNGIDNPILSHRFIYSKLYADYRKELNVCHHCDNPSCCNPNHLFIGTDADNVNDKVAKNRQLKGADVANSKLTNEQILQIRKRLAAGERQRSIASTFNVQQSLISMINTGFIWKHL